MTEKYINPHTDFGFKRLFGSEFNKELLISFLNAMFHGEQKVLDEYKKDVLSGDAEKFAEDYLNTISLDPDKDPQYAAWS